VKANRTIPTASVLAALVLLAVAITGCTQQATAVKPTPTAGTSQGTPTGGRIIAEGRVVPARSVSVSFLASGLVSQLQVAVGDRVTAGQLLAQLDARQWELQLAQADANVVAAQARVDQARRGPSQADLAAAQQAVKAAEAAYDNLLHPSQNLLNGYKADMDKTKATVDRAQAAFDRIGGESNPGAGASQERLALQFAWLDYQKAIAVYNSLATPTDAQVQQSLSAVQTARTQLAALQQQPHAVDVAAQQAAVGLAVAARDTAADLIKLSRLTAPITGTIMTLSIHKGEFAQAGAPLLVVADTSAWQVDTSDLTELNIIRIAQGTRATMTFDAIPGLELGGKVTLIKPYGETRQGDIVYTITVTPDQQDARLRWNMTAKVTFEVN
jgi:HlyD family secretion protein